MAGETGATYSLSRRCQGLAVFAEYKQDLCAAFRVFVQNWQDGAKVVFARGLVSKYFLQEK